MNDYNDIKSPKEVLSFMDKSINYGYLGKDDKIHNFYDNDFNDVWYDEYILENTKDLLKTKVGNCYDQVEFERDWFIKNGYIVKTFYEIVDTEYKNNYPTHSFFVFFDEKWNWFENSDFNNRGIHSFNTLEELLEYQKNKYIELLESFNIKEDEIEKIIIKEFQKPKEHINARDYIDFVMKR